MKSNNPETFTSTGVLAYHDGKGPRGGGEKKLKKFGIFVSHQNAPKAPTRYVQVIAVNPGATPVKISAQGSALTGADRRAFGGYTGRSPYYLVSDDMLNGRTPNKYSGTISPGGAVQLYQTVLKGGGGVEGILQTEVTDGEGVYTYVVVTNGPGLNEAVELAVGPNRKMATGNIKPQSEDDPATPKNESAFGTEAGVYSASKYTGTVPVPLPECDAYMGLSINEAGYKPVPDSARTQSVGPLAGGKGESLALADSSVRTHGNYGHEYNITLVLRNNQSTPRTVRVWFSHTAAYVSPTPNPNQRTASFYFNGSVQFNKGIAQVLITPKKATQELTIAPIVVGPGQEVRVPLRYFPPGMSSAGQQLILESKK